MYINLSGIVEYNSNINDIKFKIHRELKYKMMVYNIGIVI